MARMIKHSHKAPMEITVGGETKWICMCGLSKNYPYCDGSHELCSGELEDTLYEYDENGQRTEVAE